MGDAEKSAGDVIDAAAFLGQHPVCTQHVEGVQSLALAVLDQRNRKRFTFANDPNGYGIVGGDMLLLEQQVECGLASLACANAVFTVFPARAFGFVDDEILQQPFRADVGGQSCDASERLRANVQR